MKSGIDKKNISLDKGIGIILFSFKQTIYKLLLHTDWGKLATKLL